MNLVEYLKLFMCIKIGMWIFKSLLWTIDKRNINIGTLNIVGTFSFAYSSVSRTYIISIVNIDIAIGTMAMGTMPWFHGNHGKVTMVVGPIQVHPNEDIKVFNKHRASYHLYTILCRLLWTMYNKHCPVWQKTFPENIKPCLDLIKLCKMKHDMHRDYFGEYLLENTNIKKKISSYLSGNVNFCITFTFLVQ